MTADRLALVCCPTDPCLRCGSTTRRANGQCDACAVARHEAAMQKPCVRCGTVERRANGQCKACQRAYQKRVNATPEGKAKKRAGRDNSPEAKARRAAARSTDEQLWRRRRLRTREHVRDRERAYAKRPDVQLRKTARRYGVPAADLARLIRLQKNRCAACRDELSPGRGTHVDHDHDTGQVRGLLCKDCNLAEGFLRGSPLRARRLAAYLDAHAPKLRLVTG